MDAKPIQDSQQVSAPSPSSYSDESTTWLQVLGLGYLAVSSIAAVYRSDRNPWAIAFVVSSCVNMALFFLCLRILERTPETSPRRGPLKVTVWSLSTVLIVMFSYRVAAIMPPVLAVIAWGMATISVTTSFYALFLCRSSDTPIDACTPDSKV